mmetsp:Transcript_9442/g.23597  ORF Transcript_9442/g.23597 Transcript_9442/m.23597 type:complete len:860 (-) Transcript_9442:234-2813(-)|eukprot:CAMPEP_0113440570 /NCGR_PEP_ID=MMETSP0014_2-20120614/626_1 /TAXON_ID=2857 /ORGANISM="Nitzschia sp." /LENGTH=859 /DNA_ID=CAMNT_0000331369 /DNA_START=128 /DNA_END=2707 /DNA_ORIENTATION=+ /assembly_acc=CAM_ASM_000159
MSSNTTDPNGASVSASAGVYARESDNGALRSAELKDKLLQFVRTNSITVDPLKTEDEDVVFSFLKKNGVGLKNMGECVSFMQNERALEPFTLDHIVSIQNVENQWYDYGFNMNFKGRNEFFREVKNKLQMVTPPNSKQPTPEGKQAQLKEIDNQEIGKGQIIESSQSRMLMDAEAKTTVSGDIPELTRAISAPIPGTIQTSFSLVYSSVSGTGKTVSMLRLKQKLLDPRQIDDGDGSIIGNASPAVTVVAYLGFNSGLHLTNYEIEFALGRPNGAERVLARRLVASTIISHNNPEQITTLPPADKVYENKEIPEVSESIELLRTYMKAQNIPALSIVAGVDEVQVLNRRKDVDGNGLGRLFLRFLRKWQVEWKETYSIYILPLGTGIAVDWEVDLTTGSNKRIVGEDSVLMSKEDFRSLVSETLEGRRENKTFCDRFGQTTDRKTVEELVTALYWPRPRLLQWLVDNEHMPEVDRIDCNSRLWLEWLSLWMLDKPVNINLYPYLVPGFDPSNSSDGKIQALFELHEPGKVSVIPDGLSVPSMLDAVQDGLPVPGKMIYSKLGKPFDDLRLLHHSFRVDGYVFEDYGFNVVATAIRVGLYAMSSKYYTPDGCPKAGNSKRGNRLGLAKWFWDKGVRVRDSNDKNTKCPEPICLGSNDPTNEINNYYPFEDSKQNSFQDGVKAEIKKAFQNNRPLYIYTGNNTICDYLYFYVNTEKKLTCTICDAKHSRLPEPSTAGNTITADDQRKLFQAAVCVNQAIQQITMTADDQRKLFQAAEDANQAVQQTNQSLTLESVRLLFVTNRDSIAASKNEMLEKAKTGATNIWPGIELELLNKSTFDFGPFSDVLFARRQNSKRKREES